VLVTWNTVITLKWQCQWFTPVILATHEADISRNGVQSQPGQIVHKTLSQKLSTLDRVAQEVEWLPSKCVALSPKPRPPKKTKQNSILLSHLLSPYTWSLPTSHLFSVPRVLAFLDSECTSGLRECVLVLDSFCLA
jgi:hypothetical protein